MSGPGSFGKGGNYAWRSHPMVVNNNPLKWFPGAGWGAAAFAIFYIANSKFGIQGAFLSLFELFVELSLLRYH